MKAKLYLRLSLAFLLCFCVVNSAYAITEFGKHPYHKPGVSSEAEMKNVLLSTQDDVRTGLTKAGMPQLADSFITQIPDAEVTMVEYPTGQRFQWMFYRRNGAGPVRVDNDIVWEGDTPAPAYEFYIDQDDQRYTFAMIPICANLSLVDISPVPVEPPSPAAAVVPPPPPPASPVEAAPAPEPLTTVERTIVPVVDFGYLHQLDPANYLFLRGGLEYKITDNFSVLGMIGAAPKISGSDGTSAFIADVLANYNWSRAFVSAGVGGWITDGDDDLEAEDSDLDLIFNIGSRIYGEPDAFNVSAFLELRSAVDELDEFDLYGRIGAGLRFRF